MAYDGLPTGDFLETEEMAAERIPREAAQRAIEEAARQKLESSLGYRLEQFLGTAFIKGLGIAGMAVGGYLLLGPLAPLGGFILIGSFWVAVDG